MARALDRLLREVRCLASVCHKHVVRYHTAWIQLSPGAEGEDDQPSFAGSSGSSSSCSSATGTLGGGEGEMVVMGSQAQPALCCFLYIQMELCGGGNLRERLDARGRTPCPDKDGRLVRQLLKALAHLHAQNIV